MVGGYILSILSTLPRGQDLANHVVMDIDVKFLVVEFLESYSHPHMLGLCFL